MAKELKQKRRKKEKKSRCQTAARTSLKVKYWTAGRRRKPTETRQYYERTTTNRRTTKTLKGEKTSTKPQSNAPKTRVSTGKWR